MDAIWPKVAIIILNWNGLEDSLECLDSLQNIVYPNYAILVIDNGSRGDDVEVIKKKFPSIPIIKEKKNLGFVGGCNKGIRWALNSKAKYILLLNNDTTVDSNFLTELVNVAQTDQKVGIVGPKIYCYEQPNRIGCAGGKINFWTGITPLLGQDAIDNGFFDCVEEVDFVSGAALLIKEETIRRIGTLNEVYFAYFEEAEWCTKAKKASFKVVYVPKARIWHKAHKKGISELEIYYMTRNRFIFVKNNSNGQQKIFFYFYFMATDPILQMKNKIFLKPKLFKAYLRGVKDGLRLFNTHSIKRFKLPFI